MLQEANIYFVIRLSQVPTKGSTISQLRHLGQVPAQSLSHRSPLQLLQITAFLNVPCLLSLLSLYTWLVHIPEKITVTPPFIGYLLHTNPYVSSHFINIISLDPQKNLEIEKRTFFCHSRMSPFSFFIHLGKHNLYTLKFTHFKYAIQ